MAFERTNLRLLIGCLCLASWLVTAGAKAAPSDADRETARSLMDEGDRLKGSGDLRGAMARYQAANAIMHVPTTGLDLARVQAELGLLVEARSTAMEAMNVPVASNEPRIFADARRDASKLAGELEPRVPSLTTQVSPGDADYTLIVDGETLPPEARNVAFRTDPGQRTVRVAAPGFAPETRTVSLVEGRNSAVQITLTRLAAPATTPLTAAATLDGTPTPPVAPVPQYHPEHRGAGRVRGIIGLGVGGAALAAGIVTGVVSLSKTSHEKSMCDAGHCFVSRRSELSSANTLANVSNVTIPLGVLGIAYGLFELLTLPPATLDQARVHTVDVDFTGLGATVRGTL